MPDAVLAETLHQVYANPSLVGMDILWLTGEPLALGVDYFRRAVHKCLECSGAHRRPAFIVQTNGTLINDEWCSFFLEHDFVVGVSVDGPKCIHDLHRKTRSRHGSFEKVNAAMDLLIKRRVKGGAICVITKATLDLPAEQLFHFFHDRGIAWSYLLAASIGENVDSPYSLTIHDKERLRDYLGQLLELWSKYPESYVRDFDQTSRRVFGGAHPLLDPNNLGCLDILNVSADGGFYWGNPELMSATLGPLRHLRHRIATSNIWDIRNTAEFASYQKQVHDGIRKCADQCAFFEGCQGGNPAHKFYEHASFDAAEHTSCILNDQIIQSLMIEKLGGSLQPALAATA